MTDRPYDLAIIGGGINGCGIARDAAGRGLRVFLAEMGDLGGATSSASTKLIHGGLRYLEAYRFGYVRQALAEREVLLRSAPHIIRPLRFVLPHHAAMRPWPVLRLGLFLYDHLGVRRALPGTASLDLSHDPAGTVIRDDCRRAFEYSDCTVDDARLVVINARDAADRGADIRTRLRCLAAHRVAGSWRLTLESAANADRFQVTARALINATGPWVATAPPFGQAMRLRAAVRLVKGSHIVVDRVLDPHRAFTFQNADGRVCFAIPFEPDFTLIGTTDEDFVGDPGGARIAEPETDYLLAAVNRYLREPIRRQSIRWTFAAVRPLVDDGAARPQDTTREYVLEKDAPPGEAPLLSVIGGKITTYRVLAEAALAAFRETFPGMARPWTAGARLPGGDLPAGSLAQWIAAVRHGHSRLDPELVARLCRTYGSAAGDLLVGATKGAALGRDFGHGLSEREVAYLVDREWAATADDILWRRTKLGLRFTPQQRAALAGYLGSPHPGQTRSAATPSGPRESAC
jgi:glycerol-3-phosphate dehydrogenase